MNSVIPDGKISTTSIAPVVPYAGLIFDCDGTLADSLSVHFQTWVMAFQRFSVDLPKAWFYERSGVSAFELIEMFNSSFGYELEAIALDTERQRQFEALIHNVQEVEAVAEIARANYGQVPMAVASNGQRAVVESTLNALKLRSLFNTVVTLEDVARGKPAPDLFLLAAQRMGVSPTECIVYEDSDTGLEAANRAGMRVIDVRVLYLNSRSRQILTP